MKKIYFEKIKSTQVYAKNNLINGNENFLVYSEIQTEGIGRRGHIWDSPKGGLWFSFDTELLFEQLTLLVGIAVQEVCSETYDCTVELKWPNDIILNRKKAGGIICENINGRVIVGIGINTNIEEKISDDAISFLNVTGIKADNEEVMFKIIQRIKELAQKDANYIIGKFRDSMAYMGETKYISYLKKDCEIIGINDEGHLLVKDEGIKEISIGEIL